MKRLVLFRFHKEPEICAQKINLLKKMNPDTKIFGLGENIEGLDMMYDAGMEDLFTLDEKEKRWCWLNGDLAMLDWYEKVGHEVDFDMLHLIEWDLLLTKPLDSIYEGIKEIGLTGKIDIQRAKELDWNWVTGNMIHRYEYLCNHLDISTKEGYGCVLPGCCFCKEFLEYASNLSLPELCNDETRIGAMAASSSLEVSDTGFFDWDKERNKKFNCHNIEVTDKAVIESERNSFHPHRSLIDDLDKIIDY